MHFGQIKQLILVRAGLPMLFLFALFASCKDETTSDAIVFVTPEQGQNVIVGTNVKVKLETPSQASIDSVTYFIDNKFVRKTLKADSLLLSTEGLPLGYRMITAVISRADRRDTLITNIVLRTNQPPLKLPYKVIRTYPHDTSAYTQGLSFVDGKLLESTGQKGASELRYVDLLSGQTLRKIKIPSQYFGEGSVKVGDKIVMLTWQENVGFIFDANTFKQLGTFQYQNSREGWGLAFDGKQILKSDGTNKIWYLNATSFREEGYLEVYDHTGPIDSLNELECIDGKIYANVYLTNKIVKINPVSGRVEAEIDLSALVPKNFFKSEEEVQGNVLNGIAWDKASGRLIVGGKKWPKLYEIKLLNSTNH